MQSHNGLRRNRKALLSDLSSLVKTAKSLEIVAKEINANSVVDVGLDDIILKAFQVVTRAVKFLDVWEEDVSVMHSAEVYPYAFEGVRENTQVPPTPPADVTVFGNAEKGSVHEDIEVISDVTRQFTANNKDARDVGQEQVSVRPRYSRSSQTYMAPATSNAYQPISKQSKRESISHRVSCNINSTGFLDANLASAKLSSCHDTFLGLLGSFIGLHLQSRSSSELLLTTQQSVRSCRNLLSVVEEIWDRDMHRSKLLGDARDNMYNRITDLVEAAREIFRPTDSNEEDGFIPGEGKALVTAATTCVRGAGECVAESRFVLERIGDFAFEPLGLCISGDGLEGIDDFPLSDATLSKIRNEERIIYKDGLEDVPEPPSRTPPRPMEVSVEDLPITSAEPDNFTGPAEPPEAVVDETVPLQPTSLQVLLPPLPHLVGPLLSRNGYPSRSSSVSAVEMHSSPNERSPADSFDVSSAGGSSTYIGSMRDSEASVVSQTSTRATSPDVAYAHSLGMSPLCNSFSTSQSMLSEECAEVEANLLEKTFAHQLVYNKDGQVSGGTLPALVERLTTYDSTPDAIFVSTFYLTFRLFATPIEFAQALVDRFNYVGDSPRVAGPVRLRVSNVFKGWLESHWRPDCDTSALELILPFATRQLQLILPTAGKRLAGLVEKVRAVDSPLVPRLISSIGKTNTSIATYIAPDTPLPAPIISKSQLAALRNWKHGGSNISILDFDPLELARQFTIKESQIFCSILPEELLATEWMKNSGSRAVNVRAMSRLSTDLANLVADCILQLDDTKQRARVIKRWVKIASKCLDLANYDSLMAIICSLNSSTILRLKRTWDLVSSKTKVTLEHLKDVVDVSRNYAILRQRLQNHTPPCLPFVGTYLTDLTFVDVGNQTNRQLHGDGPEDNLTVINFDKHMKTAKIISELQRFQVAYRFVEVPELQTWMQDQLVRVRSSDQSNVQSHYRRSLLLEPREQPQHTALAVEPQASTFSKDKFERFGFGWAHSRAATPRATTPT